MGRAVVIGVMGPGDNASPQDCQAAQRLGRFIAGQGWVVLCGGRNSGVMRAVVEGATHAGGLSLGLLPGDSPGDSPCTLPLPTGLGSARNNVNVLASDVLVAVGYQPGPGTLSEIALAAKANKIVILLTHPEIARAVQSLLPQSTLSLAQDIHEAESLLEIQVAQLMGQRQPLRITLT